MTRNWPYFAIFAATTLIAHLVSLQFVPDVTMAHVLHKLALRSGIDAIAHSPVADSSQRLVVRPSPDLLYSYCPFDLANGPLHVTARVPAGTYWSVSVFDAHTDNIFAENDRQAKNGTVDFAIARAPRPAGPGPRLWVVSPTERGLVLFRTLIPDAAQVAEIDAARRQAGCRAFAEKAS